MLSVGFLTSAGNESVPKIITNNSKTDSRRVFKLGGRVVHVTRHVGQLFKVKRSKVKVTRLRDASADKKRCNSAVDGHINFKLGGNYQRGGRRVWYTF